MRVDVAPPEGGVLIAGDVQELAGLVETIIEAVGEGEATGQLLTDEGVEDLVVRCERS